MESQTTDVAAAAVTAIPVAVEPAVIRPLRAGFPGAALRMMSDARLARLIADGDRAAFEVVFARYHQELYRYCLSLLRDREDAADALQGTMLRALGALEGETRAIALRPWLYRVAHNESIDLLRRRPPRAEGAAELQAALDWNVEAGAESRARMRQLLADLRELPDRQRGALVMRELAGLGYAEIAQALDTSPAAAKQAVYEARRTLFELVKGRELDCDGIRSRLSDGDRRSMRARAVRAHLRECSGCRDFHELTDARRSALSSLLPGLPAGAAAEMLGGLGSAGAGSVIAGVATSAGIKSLAALTMVVVAGAGAAHTLPQITGASRAPERVPARVHAAPVRPAHDHGPGAFLLSRAPVGVDHGQATVQGGGERPTGHKRAATRHGGAGSHANDPNGPGAGRAATPGSAAAPGQGTARQGGRRYGGAGGGGRGGGGGGPVSTTTQVVVPQAQAGAQQVETTVGHVQEALPVRTPALPRLPKRQMGRSS